MGLDTPSGGNTSHGYYTPHGRKVSSASIFFESLPYKVNPQTGSYSREWDYGRFRQIADKCGAVLLCDMAQISGLIAAKNLPIFLKVLLLLQEKRLLNWKISHRLQSFQLVLDKSYLVPELKTRIKKYFEGDEEALPSVLEAILRRKLAGKHEETDDELMDELEVQPRDDVDDEEFESDFDNLYSTDEEILAMFLMK
ncbi:serine hydroxymethyltransferase-like [Gossypium hirsutum]|uniref:Serine hydroxymethyltransferase-like n=1 Tax=Gossypium hirsutum TaxID=3635 RepID=A0ABM2Z5G2_GOSHI|nr:serine hydroxymethyltransferase-like [Gossypium hirsutum]